MEGKSIVLAAGNPDAYPMEYYDAKTKTFQGVIPQLLREFSESSGYEVRYLEPKAWDQREYMAENCQVDIISGCVGKEAFRHRSEIILLETVSDGEAVAYSLQLTEMAPEALEEELRAFFAQVGEEKKAGLLLEGAQQPDWGYRLKSGCVFGGLLLVILFLALAIRKSRRQLKKLKKGRESDPVTGIGNLEYLHQCFDRFISDKNRVLYSMFYFYLDVPEMEKQAGRGAVDNFLRQAAAILLNSAGDADILARAAEDGFAMLRMSPSDREKEEWLGLVLQRIREIPWEGNAAGVSAGICKLRREDWDLDEILLHASRSAKAAYRGDKDYMVFTDEMLRRFREDRNLLAEMERGFQNREFQLYIQFYADTDTGRAIGGEALSRWEHPERGLLSPGEFIPFMEKEGMIGMLDYYVLEKTCAFLSDTGTMLPGDFFLSCNFSIDTFMERGFTSRCGECIGKYEFERWRLVVEVPANAVLRDADAACRIIREIKEMGLGAAMDGFGENFASVFRMEQAGIDILKLDRALLHTLENNTGKRLLKAMLRAGHELGGRVFAVGVEEEGQLSALREIGCDGIQGFCFYYPLPAWDAERMLRKEETEGRNSL